MEREPTLERLGIDPGTCPTCGSAITWKADEVAGDWYCEGPMRHKVRVVVDLAGRFAGTPGVCTLPTG